MPCKQRQVKPAFLIRKNGIVAGISPKPCTGMGHLDTDLMPTSCDQMDIHQRILLTLVKFCPFNLIFKHGFFGAGSFGVHHLCSIGLAVAEEHIFQPSFFLRKGSRQYRQIFLGHLIASHLFTELSCRLLRFCINHDTAHRLVQTMDHTDIRHTFDLLLPNKIILQPAHHIHIRRAFLLGGHPGRLHNHNNVFIFI